MVSTYFTTGRLRNDQRDIPADRQRARDVVRYAWDGADLRLAEHDTITIQDRDNRPGKREYARVPLLEDPKAATWIAAALSLVPPGRRQARGTFGINLFRTFTRVVTRPHRDDEEYCLVYVLDKVGGGAQTRLYPADTNTVVHAAALEPGELIIFTDARYLHDVTPLEPPADGGAHRDAIVCTVNYPATYPLGFSDCWPSADVTRHRPD
jgi:YD repeat-containing protein